MREILFRGKRIDNGELVEGYVWISITGSCSSCYITITNGDMYKVDPETVGQYTGCDDKDGTKIFEGDILAEESYWKIRVEYYKGMKVLDLDSVRYNNKILNSHIEYFNLSDWKIIGNVHDNPELLKSEDKEE